jgi:diguanylate cyclase (GGDEF)-like protein
MVQATKITSLGSDRDQQHKPPRFWLNQALHGCVDWLVASPQEQPRDIQNQLLHQSLTKTRTLMVSVVATSLMASIAVVLTAAPWAYAWLLAELLIGCIRLSLMSAFAKAEASGRDRNIIGPVLAGLAAFVVVSAGGYQCVESGQWALISMSAMSIAILVGAVSSRNAGTPRYGLILICILTAPFSLASLTSPIPHLFIIGIQLPLYACGVIFVMLENYKVLLNLYRSEHENRRLAQYDALTGLPNRIMNLKRFDELLAGPPAPSDEMQKELTVFCLDLDGFKDVNDRYGHAAGDALLIALADRLRDSVRTLDFVSRIGGDEFVILLPAISPAEATVIARRIIARVEAPFDVGLQAPVHVGISIGSASAPEDGKTADALLRSADRAMYEAKRRGKGLFVTLDSLEVEPVELAPAADADALMAEAFGKSGDGNRHFPLPFRSKSV